MATVSEQKILAQYTGWGGLSEAFDLHKKEWHTEFSALKKELTEKEYEAARSSALSAFFTPPEVINEMYGTLQALGVAPRSILEPSMGSGRFFGLLPDSFLESKLYGVELDELTGRMAKKLYPDAYIQIKGYEKASFRDDSFDLAIGNIPFGEYKVYDEQFHRQGQDFLIHDYFFAKSLAKVRPGGILAFVTSKGTLDKKSEEARRYLAERANLIGAVRLPNTAFQKAAGTKVSTDILFLQKKDRPTTAELIPEEDWISLDRNPDGIWMNRYFINHPEMIVGKMEMITGRFGQESACLPDLGKSFSEQLHQAMRNICKPMEREEIDAEEISDKTREIVVD
ncbi:MAG: N-6 DNA methylase, partial [Lachnospiraceae bacterium]|nr:N-6 DNA methylase [Lachnospiraceae bacterium]